MEIKESLVRFVVWICGGVVALAVAVWRLSKIWTRMEDALARIEATVHGNDGKNGMKSKLDALAAKVEALETRLNARERKGRTSDSPRRKRIA